jgi:hypothetical protein
METLVTETIYCNQNSAPWHMAARRDHSGFVQAGGYRVNDGLSQGASRNRKSAQVIVMAHDDTIRLWTRKGTPGKNGGCS